PPCRLAPAPPVAHRTSWRHPKRAPVSVPRFPQSPCPTTTLVASWDGNHILIIIMRRLLPFREALVLNQRLPDLNRAFALIQSILAFFARVGHDAADTIMLAMPRGL